MKVIKGDKFIYFDVDDTLVMWGKADSDKAIPITLDAKDGFTEYLVPHNTHIELLKGYHNKGFKVIVWSQTGVDWCEAVVKVLELESYVDLCISKPTVFVDDLSSSIFMSDDKRIHFKE